MKIKRIATFLLCLALVFVIGESSLSPFLMQADAATAKYTNVLDDLKKDKNFNPDDYPADATKNHLEIIQVAEGENAELFIYVYQPGKYNKEYRAKYINMSREDRSNRNPSFNWYSLSFVNSNGVFEKYVVDNFTVSNEVYRYYNIASVYRLFDESVDDKAEAVDGVNYIAFPVGLVWCAYYYNNELVYDCEKIDIVDIDILASGTLRYREGFKLYVDKCDSVYVGFSVENFDVDRIYDADITYTYRTKTWSYTPFVGETTSYGTPVTVKASLSEKDVASNDGDGLFGKKYTWKRIQTVDSFIKQIQETQNEGLSDDELKEVNASQFVFQFFESSYSLESDPYSGTSIERSCEVYEISILRLHFLSEGRVYNLGCVSDAVFVDNVPDFDFSNDSIFDDGEWWEILLSVLFLILFAVFLGPVIASILPSIIRLVFDGIVFILKLLFSIFIFPFSLLNKKR